MKDGPFFWQSKQELSGPESPVVALHVNRGTSDAFGAKRKLTEPRFTKSEFMNTRPVSTSARRAGRNNGHGLCLLHVGPPGTGTVGGKPNAKTAEVFASLKFSAVAAG